LREQKSSTLEELPTNIPTHVAIVMDGNGRWAQKRGLPRLAGHRAGTENLQEIIKACVDFGVKYLTIYAFSTENWGRPAEEVDGLMHILEEVIDQKLEELHQQGVQLVHIGQLERLDTSLREKVKKSIDLTKDNHRLTVCIAWNYGGRDEIVCAIRRIIEDGLKPEQICDDIVSDYLFTTGIPDPDLIIRTSGEMRISNFLIWQSAYSEWYVTPILWPDFNRDEFRKALIDYGQRERRYGLVIPCQED
jgi:undecaprenyl diphosphate synthase